jgi:glutamine amidotransferase
VVRQHPFGEVQLKDDDVTVDLSELNSPDDRLVIVVTEPLTTNEAWVAMEAGELQAFVDGRPLSRAVCKATLIAAAAAAAILREAEEAAKASAATGTAAL